ncbi:Uncharacterised protein [Mycobacteroides abscessus subsp. bolletii]|nr:Uncharacterised protein [Mycobacteroides abscessus subsp. bolletii]SHS27589.1 Uncharacterised protein [Mycobacteroides abscessus subsp. bolletii]SHS78347.1 Uncharacterised protein [Mycobacteroides abscessus subsp. bolletii]SKF64912.1 Uncharacterised protein [Mycobacteroides abscessus subsp. bolletii]SKG37582.1 Uncharacterised protein [Mycobacteroides abscessus subsp. bolletii]
MVKVRTPEYVWVAVVLGGLAGAYLLVAVVISPDAFSTLAVGILLGSAGLRALGRGSARPALVVEVIAVVACLVPPLIVGSPAGLLMGAIVVLPIAGAEVWRRFQLQKAARDRWLQLDALVHQGQGRLVWIEYANPHGQETKVSLIDPATGAETAPRSLWGRWNAGQYACITDGRRVVAVALRDDPTAAKKLAKYVT